MDLYLIGFVTGFLTGFRHFGSEAMTQSRE